jgi:hypothetical protein
MPDSYPSIQGLQLFPLKNIRNQSHAPVARKLFSVRDNNTRTFLPPVLQGIETKVSNVGCLLVVENAEDTTFLS